MCVLQNIKDQNGKQKNKGLKCYKFHNKNDLNEKKIKD
jgi:hypothetical protein